MDSLATPNLASILALKKWKVIYPAYLNSKKTLAEGRRLKKEKCVENPTCQEIKDILDNAGLKTMIEQKKMYSRDSTRDFGCQGRVRVELCDEQGRLVDGKFPHKLSVLHYLGETFPKLKGRASGSQSTSSTAGSQPAGASKGKQKGKGSKRR